MENWKIGKVQSTIVTDNDEGLKESTGHAGEQAHEYYGGALICESVMREKDRKLIAAAPDLLNALQHMCKYVRRENLFKGMLIDEAEKAIEKALK